MKINKYNISLLLVLGILLMGSMVSAIVSPVAANVTINVPGVSGILIGANAKFNVTMDAGFEAENWSGIKVYLRSASLTANLTDFFIASGNNLTNDENLNGTLDSTQFEDSNDYIITIELRNGSSADFFNITRTGITINNGVPTAATSLIPTSDTDGTVNFSATVTDSQTTSCTLIFDGTNPGLSSYTMSYSGDSCSHNLASVSEQTYRWFVRASDELDTTDSSKQTTNVDLKTGAGGSMTPQQVSGSKALAFADDGEILGIPIWIVGIIVTVLIVVVVYNRK